MRRLVRMSLCTCALAALTAGCSTYPTGTVRHLTFYSHSLQKTMKVDVYLPPRYSKNKQYPVLYLLHGKGANANSWMTTWWRGNSIHANQDANRLIGRGRIKPIVIVSPEIDNGYGVNTANHAYNVGGYSRGEYETYIDTDLVHFIDSHFSVSTARANTYIGGFSMGGFAALMIAFTHQDMYSKVAVMSAALWNGALPSSLSWIYPSTADQNARDPIVIAAHRHISIPVLIIEGTQDPFYYADLNLARVLKSQSAHVTLHVYPGKHDYRFWQSHANELLEFVDG